MIYIVGYFWMGPGIVMERNSFSFDSIVKKNYTMYIAKDYLTCRMAMNRFFYVAETYLTNKTFITSRKTTYSKSVKHPFLFLTDTHIHTHTKTLTCTITTLSSHTHARTRTFAIKSCTQKSLAKHARAPMCFFYRGMKKHRIESSI